MSEEYPHSRTAVKDSDLLFATRMGKRIRWAMDKRGTTFKSLGKAVGKHPTQVHTWVAGNRLMSIAMMTKIAQALRVSSDFLIGLKEWKDEQE